MKRVLITGKGSYIGTKVEEWLNKWPEKYQVDILDMLTDDWKEYDFHGYDSVYHVAGIAHRKDASDELYEQVNHILAVETAKRSAEAGVKQFIFMSSGAVYSQSDKKHKIIAVDQNTQFNPSTAYGKSKLFAEKDLSIVSGDIKVAIIRPPMVYGPGAKGNYNSLRKMARKSPVFPDIDNKRSMIFIDNLCEFVRLLIDVGEEGVYLPQNKEYVKTTDLVKEIAKCNGNRIYLTKAFNWFISIGSRQVNIINKVFGDFYYINTDYFDNKYQIVGFKESIKKTEAKV